MANKKSKKERRAAMAAQAARQMTQAEIWKLVYIRAIQSERIRVVVGPSKTVFNVPEGLLIRYSSVFEKMLRHPFRESIERLVELPEEDSPVFEEFLIWIHAYSPSISENTDMDSLLSLAVFADRYFVYILKNQISDLMRKALHDDRWKLTPEALWMAYNETPTESILRRLFSMAFTENLKKADSSSESKRKDGQVDWKSVFTEFSEFGWDYFRCSQELQVVLNRRTSFGSYQLGCTTNYGGACRFHDHSDVSGPGEADVSQCPHPLGAALELPDDFRFPELDPVSELGLEEASAVGGDASMNVQQHEEVLGVELEEASVANDVSLPYDTELTPAPGGFWSMG